MSSALDMTLDDLIKNNKKTGGTGTGVSRGRGRGVGSAPGPARRFANRAAIRSNPYTKPMQPAPETAWKHDMFTDQAPLAFPGLAARSIDTGTKLYISNLDYGVSNEDIEGTAELVFSRRSDALGAVKRYHNVQLDGKPMKIEIVGTNVSTPSSIPQPTNGLLGNPGVFPKRNPGRGAVTARARGGGGGRGFGRGRGRGRGGRTENVSLQDLDADLDKYHADAMQTN